MLLLLLACRSTPAEASKSCELGEAWSAWAPGLELRSLQGMVVVRADPTQWTLELHGPKSQTAREHAAEQSLSLATNAGMFHTDHRTHVGSLVVSGEDKGRPAPSYQSLAELQPSFRLVDLDEASEASTATHAVQNLRLIKKPGENRWSQQDKRWSEMLLAEDAQGRALFVFSRAPHTMHDLNELLLASDLGVVAAQHLEGGPEAQLFLSVGGCELEAVGSYETGFLESEANQVAWPVPNVLGLRPR